MFEAPLGGDEVLRAFVGVVSLLEDFFEQTCDLLQIVEARVDAVLVVLKKDLDN